MRFQFRILLFSALIFLAVSSLSGCKGVKPVKSTAPPISHSIFDGLLKKHVNDVGEVNYEGFIEDRDEFDKYLELLSNHYPNSTWTSNQRKTFWVNAYNAFTIQLICDNYPVESIKDIKRGIVFVSTVWDQEFIKIEGRKLNLNNIEHGILRKEFPDSRLHFALVCAAKSCPPLRNEAYTAEKLEAQLEEQGRNFIQNERWNKVEKDKMTISKIFSWYKGDFVEDYGSLQATIGKFTELEVKPDAEVAFTEYDWGLNRQ